MWQRASYKIIPLCGHSTYTYVNRTHDAVHDHIVCIIATTIIIIIIYKNNNNNNYYYCIGVLMESENDIIAYIIRVVTPCPAFDQQLNYIILYFLFSHASRHRDSRSYCVFFFLLKNRNKIIIDLID